jgi:phage-related protein
MADKPLLWLGSARNDVRAFPGDARRIAGYQLRRIQQGLDPSDWKPMSSVGVAVREVRIHTDRERRVLYVAKFEEGVYILHAFEKRTRKTSARDVALARERLRALIAARRNFDVSKG